MTGTAHRRRVVPLVAAGTLAVAGLTPPLLGWTSSVVVSGSMRPAVEPGDVVLTAPPAARRLRAGCVIRFRSPGRPGRSTLHRIVRVDTHGDLITKGDANRVEDAMPVPVSAVTGTQRLRVPYAGLPVLWWLRGDHLRVVLTGVVLLALGLLVPAGRARHERAARVRSRRSGPRPS
ncbi:signal peptidase I [Actinoplanes sp. NPDC020271]|uniref:signal peptidase I n=1 Tax=Actinoplanes sp. NPDC020271 TaxID=3363896 RepID=UPI0037B7247F